MDVQTRTAGQTELSVRYLRVEDLQPYNRNPVNHTEEQVSLLANAIQRYGFNQPITIDSRTRSIITGHGRLAAARKLGLATVPVVELDHLTPEQVREYRIADNQLQRRSDWDYELLTLEVNELQGIGGDLASLGFKDSELSSLLEGWGSEHARTIVERAGSTLEGIRKLIRVTCAPDQYEQVLQVIRKSLTEAGLESVLVE